MCEREKEVGKTLSLLSVFPPLCVYSMDVCGGEGEGGRQLPRCEMAAAESRLLPPFSASCSVDAATEGREGGGGGRLIVLGEERKGGGGK